MIYDVETMTEELTSEKKFSGYIYMFDFFFIIAFAMISYLTQNLVSSKIFIFYLTKREGPDIITTGRNDSYFYF